MGSYVGSAAAVLGPHARVVDVHDVPADAALEHVPPLLVVEDVRGVGLPRQAERSASAIPSATFLGSVS